MHDDMIQGARDAIDARGSLCQYKAGAVDAEVVAVISHGVQIMDSVGQAARVNTIRVMVSDTPGLKKGAAFTHLETGTIYKYMTTLADDGVTRLLQVSKVNAEVSG